MSDMKALSLEAIALKVLQKRIEQRLSEVKSQMQAALEEGDRKTAYVGDEPVGSVTYAKGSISASIIDEAAFTAFVAAEHPDQMMQTVKPSYRADVLGWSKKAGVGMTLEGEAVPGVRVGKGAGYVTVKENPDRIDLIADAVRASRVLALGGDL